MDEKVQFIDDINTVKEIEVHGVPGSVGRRVGRAAEQPFDATLTDVFQIQSIQLSLQDDGCRGRLIAPR